MIAPNQLKRFSAMVILLCAVLWFGMLGQRDLFDPDEGRYAGIPAAMVDTGDWLTPRLNDFKYFEKPVLQYWGTAVAFKIFGKKQYQCTSVDSIARFLGGPFLHACCFVFIR